MTIWTDERKAEARRLWMAGYSASVIAESIGNDCTKNSIIGLAHRGKWGQRRPAYARPGTPKGWMRAEPKPKPKPKQARPQDKSRSHAAPRPHPSPIHHPSITPPAPPPPKPRLPPGTFTLIDLRPHECRWPVNDPPRRSAAFLFCGEAVQPGARYCTRHFVLGYQKGSAPRQAHAAAWVHKPR